MGLYQEQKSIKSKARMGRKGMEERYYARKRRLRITHK
jgi:hypothetical protein